MSAPKSAPGWSTWSTCVVCEGTSGEPVPWMGVPPSVCWGCRDAGRRPAAPLRTELPPTRSDTLCGKNRYTSVEDALAALEAHAEAKGYHAATMAVVSCRLCPEFFHIVPASKVNKARHVEVERA